MATVATGVNEQAPSGKPAARVAPSRHSDHTFFSAMAVLFLATVFFGFAQSYYLQGVVELPRWKRAFAPPHPLIVQIHGIVLSLWFLLLVVQTSLVAAHRVRLHRRLGLAGFTLACLVVLLGFLVTCEHLARAFPPGDVKIAGSGGGAFTNILDLIVFSVLVYFGYRFRSNPGAHKRLMLIATLALLPPALTRWPVLFRGHFYPALMCCYAILLVVAIYDLLSIKKLHFATLLGSLFFAVVMNRALIRALAHNRTWWLHLAVHAQNLGRHLYG